MSAAFHFSPDNDEALALFEALCRLQEQGALNSVSEAEKSAVWGLICALEKHLVEPFDARYAQILERVEKTARRRGVMVALTEKEKTSLHNAHKRNLSRGGHSRLRISDATRMPA